MDEDKEKFLIHVKDLYKTLLDTRNLEINLFWQRANYFLVLNTAIAVGVFHLGTPTHRTIFAAMGLLTSVLWFCVCLGGKFWQTRWEQRLLDFEKEHLPGLEFFAAGPARIKRDVEEGLTFYKLGLPKRLLYKLVLQKPSVSCSMILLSVAFIVGWAVFIFVAVGFRTASQCPASAGVV